MILVEIKRLSPERGIEVLHCVQITDDGGDERLASYLATHFKPVGLTRQQVVTHKVRNHPTYFGEVELLRRALNELHETEQRQLRRDEERRRELAGAEDMA